MSEQNNIITCNKCQSELIGPFCSNCGKPQKIKRINGQYILTEIGSVLNFDKGILFTIRELLIRPGLNIQKFILEDRNRLVKPIVYLIIGSLVYTLLQQLLNFEDGYVNYSMDESSSISIIFDWVSKNYGYANILMSVFIAFWIKIFFRKYNYNFFEILILLCFVMGTGMLIFSFFGILNSVSKLQILDKGILLGILHISWAIGQFFQKRKILNYLKAFLSYLLGMISFSITIVVIGMVVDLIKR